MQRVDGARRLLPGLGWLVLLLALGVAAATTLASMAAKDLHGKLDAVKAATTQREQVGRLATLTTAASGLRHLRQPDDAAHRDTLLRLSVAAAGLQTGTAPDDRPRIDLLTTHVTEFIRLRREAERLAAERGPDDARRFLTGEPVRLNRLLLSRALDAMVLATDERLAHTAAAWAEARQHWLSLLVGVLAGVVLLAFLQVVRLARRPVHPPAATLPLPGLSGVG